jgi:ubiquinone/menaquinone biosynthesis C-methylase UbiE
MGLRSRLFAASYNRLMAGSERAGLAAMRRGLLDEARGNTLEIGAGTGTNLAYYSDSVTALTVTEPDTSMLRRLQRSAGESPTRTTVLRAAAEDLPFEDAAFDTVVCTLVLCGVDDQPRAVREIRRVLKPEGRLLCLEHVRSNDARIARRQDRINWFNRMTAGCECNRPTLDTLQREGFAVDGIARDEFPKAPSFTRPLIVGSAERSRS